MRTRKTPTAIARRILNEATSEHCNRHGLGGNRICPECLIEKIAAAIRRYGKVSQSGGYVTKATAQGKE